MTLGLYVQPVYETELNCMFRLEFHPQGVSHYVYENIPTFKNPR